MAYGVQPRSTMSTRPAHIPWNARAICRLAWAVVSVFAVVSLTFGLAIVPAHAFWTWHLGLELSPPALRALVLAMALIPAYTLFAVAFMALSAGATRLCGWRTPPRRELPIADLEWPLLDWVRYSICTHLVRVFAGTFFRTTPLWTFYMRLNGARLGRRVWVNSLDVMDHCLLTFGDDVVIGAGVHLSGHTVERGVVKTAPVQLERGVTVGVSASLEIGVRAGPECQIGALSVVPKYAKLEGHSTYVGIPAKKLA